MSAPPDPPARPVLRTAEELHISFVRQWAMIALAIAGPLPAPTLRLLEVTGGPHPDLPPLVESLIFGLGIFSAATLLIWASGVAGTEGSAGLGLVGLAWPTIFLIYFWRTRRRVMAVAPTNSLGILFLGAATAYSFSIPIRGHLSLIDTAVMFGLFGAYLYLASRAPPEDNRVFVGPAAAIAAP